MNIDEMKNKISMALKDPILQQGFEIICKENTELKEENKVLTQNLEDTEIVNKALEKENAELQENYRKRGKIILSLERQLRLNVHSDNLTKAKDILRMIIYWKSDKKELLNFISKAEQFLKDNEVEK